MIRVNRIESIRELGESFQHFVSQYTDAGHAYSRTQWLYSEWCDSGKDRGHLAHSWTTPQQHRDNTRMLIILPTHTSTYITITSTPPPLAPPAYRKARAQNRIVIIIYNYLKSNIQCIIRYNFGAISVPMLSTFWL